MDSNSIYTVPSASYRESLRSRVIIFYQLSTRKDSIQHDGHPPTLGGYSVSPKCYAHMTRMLMGVGSGWVDMALEGGYELMTLCASAELSMKALLGLELFPLDSAALERVPHPSAQSSLEKTITCHKNYW